MVLLMNPVWIPSSSAVEAFMVVAHPPSHRALISSAMVAQAIRVVMVCPQSEPVSVLRNDNRMAVRGQRASCARRPGTPGSVPFLELDDDQPEEQPGPRENQVEHASIRAAGQQFGVGGGQGEFERLAQRGVDGVGSGGDGGGIHPEGLETDAVEALGEVPHRLVATGTAQRLQLHADYFVRHGLARPLEGGLAAPVPDERGWASASLRIATDELTCDAVTDHIGLRPTSTRSAEGEPAFAVWMLESDLEASSSIEDHLYILMERLRDHRDAISTLAERATVEVRTLDAGGRRART